MEKRQLKIDYMKNMVYIITKGNNLFLYPRFSSVYSYCMKNTDQQKKEK